MAQFLGCLVKIIRILKSNENLMRLQNELTDAGNLLCKVADIMDRTLHAMNTPLRSAQQREWNDVYGDGAGMRSAHENRSDECGMTG